MNPRDQIPAPGQLVLDHVGMFAPDMESGARAMERLGFFMTPYTPQQHSLGPGEPVVPAGTGNRLAMLGLGYIEFLVPFADGPVADQLRAAMKRYVGLHLIALGTADASADHARLERDGFATVPLVDLQRDVDTPDGPRTARFSVARVPPGTMAEGRIQFCAHRTPERVWQERWLEQPNRAVALRGVHVCVEDVDEAARRYARFTGLEIVRAGGVAQMHTARGWLKFIDAQTCEHLLGVRPATLPWIAGCSIATADLSAAQACLRASGTEHYRTQGGTLTAHAAPALGGVFVFEPG